MNRTCLPAAVKADKKFSNRLVMDCTILYYDSYYHHHQVKIILTYYQLLTPSWLHNHSTITGPHSLNPQCLVFLPSTVANQQLLQVQLVHSTKCPI